MKRAFILLLCLCVLLCGCQQPQLRSPGAFYYHPSKPDYTGSEGVLGSEQRELEGLQEDLGALLELYCQGPLTDGLENPLPPGAAVQSYRLEDGVLTLAFNRELAQLSGIELTIAAGCLARTFLELTDARMLVLTADGALLNGQTSMELTLDRLELHDDSLERLMQDFTVYYANADRRYLIGLECSVEPSTQQTLPLQLVELLTEPPAGSGLRSALPEGTRVLSVSVVDGLCTVELSPEFESGRFYSISSQLLSLMSVVNTLTALPEIDRVEFVCDGSLLIRYGSVSIAAPLVRDLRCIGPVRTGLGEQDITIYLSHGDENRLIPMPCRLRQTGAVSLPELLIRNLLEDSGSNSISSRIPENTQLNAVTITDGLCCVDLSSHYLNRPEELFWSGRVIAASLCALPEVEQVQILVNGAVPEGFDSSLFGPLRPENSWFL